MGILYIDEAGNSGYKDQAQPNLIYGGPFIEPTQWKGILANYDKAVAKYKALIYSKFSTPEEMPKSFDYLTGQIDFFHNFHFHASEIVNGKGLWGKLNNNQPFHLLSELIDIMINHNVKFHAGLLSKAKLLNSLPASGKVDPFIDFQTLLPLYFNHFEQQIGEKQYVVIIADGEPSEKQILHTTLQSSSVQKCIPELFIKTAQSNPFLQLADAGLWVIQAYHKLQTSDTSKKSQNIRDLYQKLIPILSLYTY
ncbi:MAG: DUF3800 domain-containing protein [Bacillus sp. (in: firmicutes)]